MKAKTKLKTGVSMIVGLVVAPTIVSLFIIYVQEGRSWEVALLIWAILGYLVLALWLMNSGWNGR